MLITERVPEPEHFPGEHYNVASWPVRDSRLRSVTVRARSRLLADLAAAMGLQAAFREALAPCRQRWGGYDAGRVVVDVAVTLADGGQSISDLAAVPDQALAQIPDHVRHGTPILIRAGTAGRTQAFLKYIRPLREDGVDDRFSADAPIDEQLHRAIRMLPMRAWSHAIDADGELRDEAQVADLSGLLPSDGLPEGTRLLVRRERPDPVPNWTCSTSSRAFATN